MFQYTMSTVNQGKFPRAKGTQENHMPHRTLIEEISVCMYGCHLIFLVHPIDFILGGFIAEDPRKCCVQCELV